MRLRELIKDLNPREVQGSQDVEVTALAYDSRRVTPGTLFLALPGRNTDGHAYIAQAVERGAVAVVCSQSGPRPQRVTRIRVPDTRAALAHLADKFYGQPSRRLQLIGITGTNGKTTVSFMLKAVLEAAGRRTGLIGTVQYEVGDRVIPAWRTTPEALELHELMARMVRAQCQACVMEVSSHALVQKRVLGLGFDVAVFTNLTRDHLDYHGSMEAYFEAKQALFKALRRQPGPAASIINIDDEFGRRLSGHTEAELEVTYGMNPPARLRATDIHLSQDGCRFLLHAEAAGPSLPFDLRLIGRHNVYNALAATGAALVLGIPLNICREALASIEAVPGRLEQINLGQPFGVFVDYAHTDDALANVLKTLREITPGRLGLLFGCGGSRDTGKRSRMGRVAAQLADWAIITNDNPRREPPEQIAAQILEGYREIRPEGCAVELDRRRAIHTILAQARPGDTVLLAGKGHETYQEFEDTVVPFDDRVHAREALETLGYSDHPQSRMPRKAAG